VLDLIEKTGSTEAVTWRRWPERSIIPIWW
jgi:hypothetical protein